MMIKNLTIGNKRNIYIDILKFLACLCITNSHVPYPWYFLRVGGAFGNSIFFIVSGFLLNSKIQRGMVEWLKKRYVRLLYPMVGITVLWLGIQIITKHIVQISMNDIWEFINLYWFIFAIILYYPFYYLFASNGKKGIIIGISLWIAGYIVLYMFAIDRNIFSVELAGFSGFKVYFYFGIFLLGAWMQYMNESIYIETKKQVIGLMVIIALALLAWAWEYMCVLIFNHCRYQCILHVCISIFAMGILVLFLKCVPQMITIDKMKAHSNIMNFILSLSEATLEIYLMQMTFKNMVYQIKSPIKIIVFWIVAFVGGVLFHKFIGWIGKVSKKKSVCEQMSDK